MASWSRTKREIRDHVENIVRRLQSSTVLNLQDKRVIDAALNTTLIDIFTDRSVGFKMATSDTTVTLVGGQNFIDLPDGIISIKEGTVRIVNEAIRLGAISLGSFYGLDVGEDSSGLPTFYAIDSASSINAIRLRFRPIPDQAYTLNLTVETLPDEDDVADIPNWMHAMLLAGTAAQSLELLGFLNEAVLFQRRYDDRIMNAREKERGISGPIHLNRRQSTVIGRSPQDRRPIT